MRGVEFAKCGIEGCRCACEGVAIVFPMDIPPGTPFEIVHLPFCDDEHLDGQIELFRHNRGNRFRFEVVAPNDVEAWERKYLGNREDPVTDLTFRSR